LNNEPHQWKTPEVEHDWTPEQCETRRVVHQLHEPSSTDWYKGLPEHGMPPEMLIKIVGEISSRLAEIRTSWVLCGLSGPILEVGDIFARQNVVLRLPRDANVRMDLARQLDNYFHENAVAFPAKQKNPT
jgi:hypothetical protein